MDNSIPKTNNKTQGKIEALVEVKVPPIYTALATGASVELVKKVRSGNRGKGKKAQRVEAADEYIKVGISRIIKEARQNQSI